VVAQVHTPIWCGLDVALKIDNNNNNNNIIIIIIIIHLF
jgi:hypothetical protein